MKNVKDKKKEKKNEFKQEMKNYGEESKTQKRTKMTLITQLTVVIRYQFIG